MRINRSIITNFQQLLDWGYITGRPTTLSGYGITDAISGSGTTNYLPKFATSTSVGNSLIYDDGSSILIGTTTSNGAKLQVSGSITFTTSLSTTGFAVNANPTTAGTNQTYSRFLNTSGDFYVGVESSTNGGFFTDSTAYASVLYSSQPIQFIIGGTKRLNIATTGAATFSSTIQTANPTSGTAKPWKLGAVITDGCGVPSTFGEFANTLTDKFIEVEIDGVFYYIPVRTPGWC